MMCLEEEFGVMNSESLCIPHYEVIKRSIIKSLDYYYDPNALNAENMISGTTGGNGGSGSGGNSNRMEAISLLLVELCANANSSVKYSKCISTGFDKIFEIINELNKDVPCVNALIACYLTRCVVDEIVPPRYIVDWLRKCETMKAECENEEAVNDTAGTEGPDVCDEMNQDKREMVKNIGDIINRTKVHLSHPHYSNKLQHIWGVGSITGDDDGYASEQHIANNIISSTVELKQKIDAILSEYFDNCPCTGVSGASSPGNENGSSNSTEYCYIPPSVSLLTDTYKNMKTLGASAMNYYAHEIVKRAISMVLLNYRAVGPSNPSTVFNQLSKDLSVASAMYIESNTSSLFLCFNTAILFHFLMCGEDKDPLLGVVDAIETVCGCGENSNTIVVPNGACITETTVTSEFLKGIYPQLPPPVVSKLQFFKGLLRFFESHEAIEGNSDGGLSVKYSTESLMYDILLDAPYAHYMLHHILLLSKQNACNLLPSKVPPLPPNSENLCDEVDAFQALVGVLQPYVK